MSREQERRCDSLGRERRGVTNHEAIGVSLEYVGSLLYLWIWRSLGQANDRILV